MKPTYMHTITILVMVITLSNQLPDPDKCGASYKPVVCRYNTQIYPVYKILEEELVKDKGQLFILKQTFFPPYVPHNWKVDGVDIVPILCSLKVDSIQTCSNSTPDNVPEKYTEWTFIWTNSLLYTLIPTEQLMAFDRIVTKQILDALMKSHFTIRQVRLSFHLKQLPCEATKEDVFDAMAALRSWIKAYSQAQGLPTNWEESSLGYVSETKERYWKKPYTTGRKTLDGMNILFLLLFIAINTLIPIVVPCLGHRLQVKVQETRMPPNLIKNIWVGAIVSTVVNILYIAATVRGYIHDYRFYSSTGNRSHAETTLYFKMFICPVAFTIEMIAAGYSVRQFYIEYELYSNRSRRFRNAMLCLRVLAIWQYYIIIHILFGLFAVPLCVYLLISPGLTLNTIGSFIAALIGTHGVILSIVSIKCCTRNPRKVALSCFFALQKFLIIISTTCAVILYYLIVLTGLNQSGLVRFTLSILPIPLSLVIWFIKRRLFGKNVDGQKTLQSSLHRYSSTDSSSAALLGPEDHDSESLKQQENYTL